MTPFLSWILCSLLFLEVITSVSLFIATWNHFVHHRFIVYMPVRLCDRNDAEEGWLLSDSVSKFAAVPEVIVEAEAEIFVH
jgi:hypothetical protein